MVESTKAAGILLFLLQDSKGRREMSLEFKSRARGEVTQFVTVSAALPTTH